MNWGIGMEQEQYDLGMIGLGVMGSNLSLNMAEHGYAISGLDKDPGKVKALQVESHPNRVDATIDINEFVHSLKHPRAVMMMVPAGSLVDAVLRELIPLLEKGDLIIDGGNSYYKDTELRQKTLKENGISFLGIGISGGEQGARNGASLMPGGPEDAYRRVEPILRSVAARVNGDACIAYLGPGASGHYVKMVHNGIEYGLMELIAESYDLMKRGLGMPDDEIQRQFAAWNQTELNSYLLEITADIFTVMDEQSGKRLIDLILDEAKQKGTGKWTSQDAMDLAVPVPSIDAAVSSRDLSAFKQERGQASHVLKEPMPAFGVEQGAFLERLQHALYAGMLITYGQGMAQLYVASKEYGYQLEMDTVAKIWREAASFGRPS